MLACVKMEEEAGPWGSYTTLLEDTLAQVQEILGTTDIVEELEQEVRGVIKEEPLEEEQGEGSQGAWEQAEGTEDFMLGSCDDFSPRQRSRCNTWPRRGLAGGGGPKEEGLPLVCEEAREEGEEGEEAEGELTPSLLPVPKSNSRRNPWGNFSYADLITQAIQSSPEGRLTLAQIYDWMIATVPYFSQRADSSSSAGWKNSIRHNLSLHQRFLKVQNEGAGKSSWWTLNPERRLGAKPRRRATSGDLKALQTKREKARRKAESLRAGGRLVRTSSTTGLPPPSPSSDSLPDSFRPRSKSSASLDSTYFPFRSRTLSNASSVSQTSPRRLRSEPEEPLHGGLDGGLDDRMDDQMDGGLDSGMEDLLPDLGLLTGTGCGLGGGQAGPSADLDSITLDDLTLGAAGPAAAIGDPAVIIREYLHPSAGPLGKPARDHRLKILEPREETVGRSVIKHTNAELLANISPPLCYTSNLFSASLACRARHDEARKDMIRTNLEVLRQKRHEVRGDRRVISRDNRRSLESAFDIQIRLLQEELDKQSRQENNGQSAQMEMDIPTETLEDERREELGFGPPSPVPSFLASPVPQHLPLASHMPQHLPLSSPVPQHLPLSSTVPHHLPRPPPPVPPLRLWTYGTRVPEVTSSCI